LIKSALINSRSPDNERDEFFIVAKPGSHAASDFTVQAEADRRKKLPNIFTSLAYISFIQPLPAMSGFLAFDVFHPSRRWCQPKCSKHNLDG
jgi:hypothetical protein